MSDEKKQVTCANCGATVRRGQGLMKKANEGWVCAVCLRLPALLARIAALEERVRELQWWLMPATPTGEAGAPLDAESIEWAKQYVDNAGKYPNADYDTQGFMPHP